MVAESMTKEQAARFLQISERTLDRWRAEGFLRCFKHKGTVRFDPKYLESVLAKQTRRRTSAVVEDQAEPAGLAT
jgi:predicted site-specific integrase-resolvase